MNGESITIWFPPCSREELSCTRLVPGPVYSVQAHLHWLVCSGEDGVKVKALLSK